MRWIISFHAAQRFMERHAPELDMTRALQVMQAALPEVKQLPSLSHTGAEHWLLKPFNVILVVEAKRDERVVVTVLPDLWRPKRRRSRRRCAPPVQKAS